VGDDIPHGLALVLGGGLILTGADAGEFLAQAPGGGQQEVARSAGGVENADGQKSVFGE
jgi:hypothetical protein